MPSPWKLLRVLPILAVAVSGCGGGGNGKLPQSFSAQALFEPVPIVPTDQQIIPFPFDPLFFPDATATTFAPTLNIPNPDGISFVAAANQLDGFSTTADIFADVAYSLLDYSSIDHHILIVYVDSAGTPHQLQYGTDFIVENEDATGPDPVLKDAGGNPLQTPISSQRSRVRIEPLKPLLPSTTYLVALTNGVRTVNGGSLTRSPEFEVTASATPVASQTTPVLSLLDDTQKATLEALRANFIYPTVTNIAAITGVKPDSIVLAWSFTTQSIGLSLGALAQSLPAPAPSDIAVQATGITTDQAGAGIPAGADIYAGYVDVPYYLKDSGGDTHSTAPLTSFWLADPTKPNIDPTDPTHKPALLGEFPCAGFATGATVPLSAVQTVTLVPSTSTTLCFPVPVEQSVEKIPLLVTVPNAASGHATEPANGWPVVIFQHGITRNRTDMLAIAPTLAQAGFVTVAIDLPLHGITDPTNPFYRNQLFFGSPAAGLMTGERTFDLDLEANTPDPSNPCAAPGPDGNIDPSGAWFVNLSSPLTSRDNLRQAEADLMSLRAALSVLDLNHDGHPDIDTTQIRYAGISLGSIVGIPFLANDTAVGAASLAVPGGGIAKLLDASKSFGPVISQGLACNNVDEGSDDYETFLRFAQHAADDGDPLNYAAAARAAHPIHMIEVVGGGSDGNGGTFPSDTVVPNNALSTCPAVLPGGILSTAQLAAACPGTASRDTVVDASRTAGTDPLIAAMGLNTLGPIDVPVSASATLGANLGYVVKFKEGAHGSLLDPSSSAAATQEMQSEVASFLASDGQCLPLGLGTPCQ